MIRTLKSNLPKYVQQLSVYNHKFMEEYYVKYPSNMKRNLKSSCTA